MKKFITLLLLCLTGMAAWATDIENVAFKNDASMYLNAAVSNDVVNVGTTAQNFSIKAVSGEEKAYQLYNNDISRWINSGSNGYLSSASAQSNARYFYFYQVSTASNAMINATPVATPEVGKKYVIVVKNTNSGYEGYYAVYGQLASGKTNRLDAIKLSDSLPGTLMITGKTSSTGDFDYTKMVWSIEQLSAPEPPVDVTKTYYLKDTGISQYVVVPSTTGSSANVTPSTTDKSEVKFVAVSGGYSIQDVNNNIYIGIDSWYAVGSTTAQAWEIAKVEGGITIKNTSGTYAGKYFGGQSGKTKFYNNNANAIVFSLEEVNDIPEGPTYSFKTSPAPVSGVWQKGTKFYSIKEKRAGYLCASQLPNIKSQTAAPTTDDGKWAVIANGSYFQFMNKDTQKVLTFASTDNDALASTTGDLTDTNSIFDVVTYQNPSFEAGYECFTIAGADAYPNDKDTGLAIWNTAQALWGWGKSASNPGSGDDGSKFKFSLVEELTDVTYTVSVVGAPTGATVTVTVKGETVVNNSVTLSSTASATDVVATDITAYSYSVEVGTNTITVTYTPNDINASINYTPLTTSCWSVMSNPPSALTSQYSATDLRVIERTYVIENAGSLQSSFIYTGGNHRIDIAGVDVVDASGNVVASDYHFGYCGGNRSNNVYTVSIPVGTYTVRYIATAHSSDGSNTNTNGHIDNVFTPFTTEVYTVNITGAPSEAKVTYDSAEYADGDTFEATGLQLSELSATDIEGYSYSIAIEGTDVNVEYTEDPYVVGKKYIIKSVGHANNKVYYILPPTSGTKCVITETEPTSEDDAWTVAAVTPQADGSYNVSFKNGSQYFAFLATTTATNHAVKLSQFDVDNSNYVNIQDNLNYWPDKSTDTRLLYMAVKDDYATSRTIGWGGAVNNAIRSAGYSYQYEICEYVAKVPVTYTFTLDGKTLGTKVVNETMGAAPTVASIIPSYVEATGIPTTVETNAYTIETSYTGLPFEVGTKKYYVNISNGLYWLYANSSYTCVKEATTKGTGSDYEWTVGGDWLNGFSFVNGQGYYMAAPSATPANGNNTTVATTDGALTRFDIVQNGSYGYRFKPHGGSNYIAHTSLSSLNLGFFDYYGRDASYNVGNMLKFVPAGLEITIGATGYATMAYAEDFVKPEGLKVYYCLDEGEAGHLSPVEWDKNYIPGYCAYILEGTPNTTYTFNEVANDFEIPAEDYDAVSEIFNDGVLIGNYSDEAITLDAAKADFGDNIYVFSKVNDKMGFYKYAGTTLAAHKAFYATDEASVQGFILDFNGTEGINAVMSATNLKAGYDIQGRRINKMQKGINILNGKKIIK